LDDRIREIKGSITRHRRPDGVDDFQITLQAGVARIHLALMLHTFTSWRQLTSRSGSNLRRRQGRFMSYPLRRPGHTSHEARLMMGEGLRRVFKDPTVMVVLLLAFAGDMRQPWVAAALLAATGLISWPAAKRSERRTWLCRKDGRIHAIDYFALIAVLATVAAVGLSAFESLDVDLECWVRTGHLLGSTCDRPLSY
jgi:hypothetical protein